MLIARTLLNTSSFFLLFNLVQGSTGKEPVRKPGFIANHSQYKITSILQYNDNFLQISSHDYILSTLNLSGTQGEQGLPKTI